MEHRPGQAPDNDHQYGKQKSPVTADHLRSLVSKSREKFPHTYHPPNRALFNFRTNATVACVRQACNCTVKREPMLVGATKVPVPWAGSDRSGKPCKDSTGFPRRAGFQAVGPQP